MQSNAVAWVWMAVVAALSLAMSPPIAAQVAVGAGSVVNFGDADVDFGCSDLSIEGAVEAIAADLTAIADLRLAGGGLAPGGSRVSLGGDFDNQGTFAPGTSWLEIVDACGSGVSQVSGGSAFHELSVVTTSGKQFVLPAQLTQSVTQALTLQGAGGSLLQVRSSAAGQRARLAVANGASQTIAFVEAMDNHATVATIAPGPAALYDSIDAGNLINWFENPTGEEPPGGGTPRPVPGLGLLGVWLLVMLLLAGVCVVRRRPSDAVWIAVHLD